MSRSSSTASRPAASTVARISRSGARSCPSISRTPPVRMVITLTLWTTMSCSSRAMRARSAETASRASSSPRPAARTASAR
ncbi:hypothetical protein [Nonomuraea harbinensis]|uniref:Uncharacterized protein n=1 Tax=Nonomuraea harbinensis TaxID=1286938 RepID=A0ABW1BMN3_9ACTN|nr:hypothetical protein [Nonomuraea harbinensis]